MPALPFCPLCGERVQNLIEHLRSPEGEGCPETPLPPHGEMPELDASEE